MNDEMMSELFSEVWALIDERYKGDYDRYFSDMKNTMDVYDDQPFRDALNDFYGFTHAEPDVFEEILDFWGIRVNDGVIEREDV